MMQGVEKLKYGLGVRAIRTFLPVCRKRALQISGLFDRFRRHTRALAMQSYHTCIITLSCRCGLVEQFSPN